MRYDKRKHAMFGLIVVQLAQYNEIWPFLKNGDDWPEELAYHELNKQAIRILMKDWEEFIDGDQELAWQIAEKHDCMTLHQTLDSIFDGDLHEKFFMEKH